MKKHFKNWSAILTIGFLGFYWGTNAGFALGSDVFHCANYAALNYHGMVEDNVVDEACEEVHDWSRYNPTVLARRLYLAVNGDHP